MARKFDDQLLQDYMTRFYGYGNYEGSYWFVGIEEATGDFLEFFENITARLNTWRERGRNELEDVAEYHIQMGESRFWGERPKLQTTWNKLIRILLSAERGEVTTENVRAYQSEALGRRGSNTCLLELLPLPSPSVAQWSYAKYTALPFLSSRENYVRHYLPGRIAYLKQRIEEYQPKAVIFYGVGYQESWRQIARVPMQQAGQDGPFFGNNGRTVFTITKHPAAKGITNAYFHLVGKNIAVIAKTLRNTEDAGTHIRKGWEEAFAEMAGHGDDSLVDDLPARTDWDERDWQW